MAGIHLHPHDILDEGPAAILRRLEPMADVDLLFVEVNTIFERNPYPSGTLPHNPVHDVVQGTGTLHVRLPAPRSRLVQRVDGTIASGADPLGAITEAVRGTRFRVIPWVNICNGDFAGASSDNAVLDFRGDAVAHWLCPNGPDIAEMWRETLSAIRATYGLSTFLIDRIRYPDWAGVTVSPRGLFTCFCPHCERGLRDRGIDVAAVRGRLVELVGALKSGQFDAVAEALAGDPLLAAWHAFRQASVTRLVERLRSTAGDGDDALTLWLDLWPPAYGWLLGQDYASLTKLSPALKHFPYHKLGGGADVQGLIGYVADNDDARELAFAAFKRLFSLPFDLTYRQFTARGFPIEFVRQQNDRVRQLSQPGTIIYSGIQMWNLEPAELLEAIAAADASACDDVIYYCYGWADDRLIAAAGAASTKHSKSRR